MAGLGVAVHNGERFDNPGEKIDEATELKLKGEKLKYVSRGGLKLEKALDLYEIDLQDKVTLDIGASTGGFTDVMLKNGGALVYAVDVGTYSSTSMRFSLNTLRISSSCFRVAHSSSAHITLYIFTSIFNKFCIIRC